MKPIIFHNMGEIQVLAGVFLEAGILDDWAVQNLPMWFTGGMYWELESIPGFVGLNNIIPGREATVYVVTLEGKNVRTTSRVERRKYNRLALGQYKQFLEELWAWGRMVFRDFGFVRLTATCREDNLTSRLLIRRLNFTLEGILRSATRRKGVVADLYTYGILREEVITREHLLQSVAVRHADKPVLAAAGGEPDDAAKPPVAGGRREPIRSSRPRRRRKGRADGWRRLFRWLPAGGR